METIDRDLRLLASFAITPKLGEQLADGVLVTRPLTRLMMAVDPEHGLEDAAGRKRRKTKLLDEIYSQIPPQLQTRSMRRDIEMLVHVTTWGTKSFELAHYTDRQIALAVAKIGGARAPSVSDLQKAVKSIQVYGDLISGICGRTGEGSAKFSWQRPFGRILNRG